LGRRRIGIAESFSRIFFRNAINNGLPTIELAVGIDAMEKGDPVSINFEKGVALHEGNEHHFPALPEEVLAILEDGGLIPHVKKVLAKSG